VTPLRGRDPPLHARRPVPIARDADRIQRRSNGQDRAALPRRQEGADRVLEDVMKSRRIALALVALSIVGVVAVAQSDAPSGKVVIPPRVEDVELPAFDAEAFPREKSKAPTADEWKAATH